MANLKEVLIVGAGIAGLTLGISLVKKGLAPVMIEKSKSFEAIGAGIALPANATAALKYLGIFEETADIAYRVRKFIYTDDQGNILHTSNLENIAPNNPHFLALQRSSLQKILVNNYNLPIRLDSSIKKIQESEGSIHTLLTNNQTLAADLIVGADGIRSKVRELIYGTYEPLYLGIRNWRFICERPAGLKEPMYMLGKNDIFMLYPVDEGKVYCYGQINAPEKIILENQDSIEFFKNIFCNYKGFVPEVLEQVTKSSQLIMGWSETLNKIFWPKNKTVLIGDAAHACSTMLQQGAAQAMEDAIILAHLIATKNNYQTILSEFTELRKERVEWVVHQSDKRMQKVSNLENQIIARNNEIKQDGPPSVRAWKTLFQDDPFLPLQKIN